VFSKFSHAVVSRIVILVMFLLSIGFCFGFLALIKSSIQSMIESGDFKNHMFVIDSFATFAWIIFGVAIGAVVGFLFPIIYTKTARIYGLLSIVTGGLVGLSLATYLFGIGNGYPDLPLIGLNAMLYLIGGGIVLMATWEENWLIKTSV